MCQKYKFQYKKIFKPPRSPKLELNKSQNRKMENTQKPTFKYVRRAEKIGGSILVTIPAIWVKANNVQDGDELLLEVTAEQVVIKKHKPNQNHN
jgi:hypothetical protein